MINKGYVSDIKEAGRKATVVPAFEGTSVSVELVVPFFLWECLEVKMPVVYAVFPDNTGVVLARMDGEWNHKLYDGLELATGDMSIPGGDLKAGAVPGYNGHTHSGVEAGPGVTNGPQ